MLKLPRKVAVALTVAALTATTPTLALAQQQPQQQPQQPQQRQQQGQQQQPQVAMNPARTIAGLADVAAANFMVINQGLADPSLLSNLVNEQGAQLAPGLVPQQGQQQGQQQAQQQPGQQVRIVQLARGMDNTAQTQLQQALRSSEFLQRNATLAQQAIRANQTLGQALQRNNIQPNQVVALDVLSQRDTIYVLPSGQWLQGQQQGQQGQQGQQQPGAQQQQPQQQGTPRG